MVEDKIFVDYLAWRNKHTNTKDIDIKAVEMRGVNCIVTWTCRGVSQHEELINIWEMLIFLNKYK